jgi:hypothetical protein
MEDRLARELVRGVEKALERVDSLGELERAAAHQAIAGICELYGEALARLLSEGARRDDGSWLVRFARTDELVSHLLLLHGLHPDGEEPLERLLAVESSVREDANRGAGNGGRPSPREPELVRLGHRTAPIAAP